MKINQTLVYHILIVLLFCSCTATIGYYNENVPYYPPTNPAGIKIYAERHPDFEVIELGYVASHNTQQPKGDFLKEEIRKKCLPLFD